MADIYSATVCSLPGDSSPLTIALGTVFSLNVVYSLNLSLEKYIKHLKEKVKKLWWRLKGPVERYVDVLIDRLHFCSAHDWLKSLGLIYALILLM